MELTVSTFPCLFSHSPNTGSTAAADTKVHPTLKLADVGIDDTTSEIGRKVFIFEV
jgi:hypothetical protein